MDTKCECSGNLQLEAVTSFIQAKIAFERIMTPVAQQFGLTPISAVSLNLIAHQENPTVGSVFRALDLNQGNVSSMCKKLESDGFILRQRSRSDERSVILTITEKGRSALAGIEHVLQDNLSDPAIVSPEELERAKVGLGALKQMIQNIEKKQTQKGVEEANKHA